MTAELPIPSAQLADVASAVSGVFAQALGRGPEKARATQPFPSGTGSPFQQIVICVLTGLPSPAEETLLRAGDVDGAAQIRRRVRRSLNVPLADAVTAATGRTVLGQAGSWDAQTLTGVETFILGPARG